MIITFPRFGPASMALSEIFNVLGIQYIMPEQNSDKILKVGSAISPEEMCIPFKYMAGNLKTAYGEGADTAVMIATCGPCRLGEYGQLLMEVMKASGCSYRWILLDTPTVIGRREFVRRAGYLLEEGRNTSKRPGAGMITRSLLLSIALIRKTDLLWQRAGVKAGFVSKPENIVRLLKETQRGLEEAGDFRESFIAIKKAEKKLRTMEKTSQSDTVRLLVTGEIYTCIEREANNNLEEKLMRLGCSVTRHISVSWWIKNTLLQVCLPEVIRKMFFSQKGIRCNIGGYGRESVSKIIRAGKFDGIIKIMPTGCMPEIVTKSFCENMPKKSDYKILNLVYDEMSGEAGYDTRIEAFVDMLERRKNVLAGDRHRFNKYRFSNNK